MQRLDRLDDLFGTRKLAGGAILFFGARAVAGRFVAVSANRHPAPASRMAAGTVDKEQRTIMPFTGFDMGEVVLDNQIGHGSGIGISRESGERQRRCICSARPLWPCAGSEP